MPYGYPKQAICICLKKTIGGFESERTLEKRPERRYECCE
jgi:hypothetical protein